MVLPPFIGGLHCGAASGISPFRISRVLPPFIGGLHCGGCQPPALPPELRPCSRRSSAGSIAARTSAGVCDLCGSVLPPFIGGLHCGGFFPLFPVHLVPVLPPFIGGLHCGIQ